MFFLFLVPGVAHCFFFFRVIISYWLWCEEFKYMSSQKKAFFFTMGKATACMSPSPQLCFVFLRGWGVGFDCWSVAWFVWCSIVLFWGRLTGLESGWPWTQRLLGSTHSSARITGVCPHIQILLWYAVDTPGKHPVLFRVWTSANLTSLPPASLCSQPGRAGPAANTAEIWRIGNLAFRCQCACLGCRQQLGCFHRVYII